MEIIKTRQRIAGEFNTYPKTLIRWLKVHGVILPPCALTLYWQKLIYETLGYPPSVNKSDYENV